jgi:hypothetical protein
VSQARAGIEQLSADQVNPDVQRFLLRMAEDVEAAMRGAANEWLAKPRSLTQPPEDFTAAERHCRLHAAVACMQVWLRNRDAWDEFFSCGEWLVLALWQLTGAGGTAPPAVWYENAFLRLDALDSGHFALALEPFPVPARDVEDRRRVAS